MNHTLKILHKRARIIQQIRSFFIERKFLEVETPHRIETNAPEPHIDAVESTGMWLQTSPELAMKRLLAAGCGNIFQLCRVWRGNERGSRHLPEFSLLEWYRPHSDYHSLMTDCENLLLKLVPEKSLTYRGERIDLAPPWRRLTVKEAFRLYADCSAEQAIENNRFEEVLTDQVEPALGFGPIFLTEYPAPLAALARLKSDDTSVAERCELYIGGLELANGFSELTDPAEQRIRFEADEEERRRQGKPPCPLPEDFLADLHNMPEAAGIALGVDRLVMLLTDAASIDEVVAFPPG
ncbi:MAG: EF-P lysine aminoacylase GenX [Desulfuromonas sp.]|nr:MAG: EF-P lysine aminoacylase GenX [Desulfuromonas sp.]